MKKANKNSVLATKQRYGIKNKTIWQLDTTIIDSIDKKVKEWMYIHKTLAEKKVWQTNNSESMPCPHFPHVCVIVTVMSKIFTTSESFGCLLAEKGPNTRKCRSRF